MTTPHLSTGLRRGLTMLAALVAVALLVAACGGDDDVDDASADDTDVGESSDDSGDDDGAPTDDDDDGSDGTAGGGDDGFCADLETYATDAVALTSAFFTADSDAIRAAAAPIRGDTDAVAASAPADLAADVVLVNDNYLRVIDTLEASDFDLDSLTSIGADPPEVAAAWDRINAHAVGECGFDPESMATGAGSPG